MSREGSPRPDAKLTLGPLLFNWPAERARDFYFRIAEEAPVDTVCIGEVVCSKRAPFFAPYLPAVVARLEGAGKEVVHSALALVMSKRERRDLAALAAADDLFVEANDLAAVALLDGRDHAIGPYVNVYNEGTLAFLARRGARRVSLPFELPARALAALAEAAETMESPPELEVQVFGRTPLAISARCYHARAQGLHRNNCQYVCEADRDGMALDTLDGAPFLAVNGTQTLSHGIGNLVGELAALRAMGIGRFRLSPQDLDMVAVAETFRAVLDGELEPDAALERLTELAAFAPFVHGFYHGAEGAARIGADPLGSE
ncbi:MAG: ubiquinone anaerobic biosynthesis protein UbiV [Alphaproteobacteria bacterium]